MGEGSGCDDRWSILVVDDEAVVRDPVVRRLRSCGYDCTGASSCTEARSVLEERDVHLLIADIHLDAGSGLELAQAAIEADPDLAVLILTGLDDCSDVWRCCSNADSPPGPDVSPWIERPNRSRLWTVVRRQDDRDGDRGC